MILIILAILIVLALSGGGYYGGWHSAYPQFYTGGIGIGTVIVLCLVVLLLTGRL